MKKKKKESYSIKTRYQLINWIIVVDKIDRQIDEWLGKRRGGTSWSKTTSHSLHSFIILPSYPSLVSSTFFPPKTPQGTLDEAVVGRKNRTLHVLPLPSVHPSNRLVHHLLFPPHQGTVIPYLCSTAFYALHLEPSLAPFYATIPIPLLSLFLFFSFFFTPSTRTFSLANIGENES